MYQLQQAVALLIRLFIRSPFLAIGAVIAAMLIDWKLGLILLVATPVIALILYMVMSRSVPFYKKAQKKLDRISLVSREGLSGVRVIRAFSKQEEEQKRFDDGMPQNAGTQSLHKPASAHGTAAWHRDSGLQTGSQAWD